MTYYKTRWDFKIEPVEITRATESFIFLPNGRREAIRASYTSYHATWDEAKAFLIRRERTKWERLTEQVNDAFQSLKEAELLKP